MLAFFHPPTIAVGRIRLLPQAPRALTAAWQEEFAVHFEHSPFGGANALRLTKVLLQKGGEGKYLVCCTNHLSLLYSVSDVSRRITHMIRDA